MPIQRRFFGYAWKRHLQASKHESKAKVVENIYKCIQFTADAVAVAVEAVWGGLPEACKGAMRAQTDQ